MVLARIVVLAHIMVLAYVMVLARVMELAVNTYCGVTPCYGFIRQPLVWCCPVLWCQHMLVLTYFVIL